MCLAQGGRLHKHCGFLGAQTDNQHVCVHGEGRTITKMHWLKLDPYRYQTES